MAEKNFNILDYILSQTGAKPLKKGDKVLLNPCPVCGHRDHFYIYPKTNSYYSFSGCCRGGTLVDWLVEYEGLSLSEAMVKVHGDTPPPDRRTDTETKRLAKLLTENVGSFFDTCIDRYQFFSKTEQELTDAGFEYTNPLFRWVRQGLRFYDRVTNEFIFGDFSAQVRLMRNHRAEYFFKLNPGGCCH